MIRETITTWLGGNRSPVVHECRHCGETVDSDLDDCPHCGPGAEIVTYDLE